VCFIAATSIQAQNFYQPTQTDLKAAYCRPVVADTIAMHNKSLSADLPPSRRAGTQEQLAAATERSRRLELYVLPRLNLVEPTGLIAAQTRGKEDAARLGELMQACDSKCKNTVDAQSRPACMQQCVNGSEVAARTRECDDVAWLPLL
jgi:hypothetical protein